MVVALWTHRTFGKLQQCGMHSMQLTYGRQFWVRIQCSNSSINREGKMVNGEEEEAVNIIGNHLVRQLRLENICIKAM